jgi:hypothetical protein
MAPQHTRCSSLVAGKRPVLLVYVRIALPAIRSAKPGRRKTAAAIIRQLRNAWTGGERR